MTARTGRTAAARGLPTGGPPTQGSPTDRSRSHRLPRPGLRLVLAPVAVLSLLLAGCTAGGQSGDSASGDMSGQASAQSGAAPSSAPASPRPSATPVAKPAGTGDAKTVEKDGSEPPVEEVGLDDVAVVMGYASSGVSVSIPEIRSANAEATGPGEVSGPALVVTVAVENTLTEPLDLSQVVVNMTDSAGAPGAGMVGEPAKWLEGTLEPGASAKGTYVFAIAPGVRAPITVEVSLGASTTTAQFVGDAK